MNILLSFSGVMSNIFYVVIAILILLLMITIHEFGHYTAGKILGFKINEFSIGFGPAIFKKANKKTGEIFSVRLVPLGGFCAFCGEDEDNENPQAFNNQKPWKRLIVLFSGVFFNFLSAILFSVVLLAVVGNPLSYRQIDKMDTASTNYVLNGGTLQEGDILMAVNGREVSYWDFTSAFDTQIKEFDAGESFTIKIKRDGVIQNVSVTKYNINVTDADGNLTYKDGEVVTRAVIGINSMTIVKQNFGQALINAVPFTLALCWLVLVTLGMLFTGGLGISDIGGPVTTIATIATVSQTNALNILYLIPLIATNLAVFNILPFPALDGARMVFTGIEWIRKKPINRKVEGMIHTVGLIVLFAFVIIVDILHLFI